MLRPESICWPGSRRRARTPSPPQDASAKASGDPTEIALLELAADRGQAVSASGRESGRSAVFHFDPRIKLMTTLDQDGGSLTIHTKGAPEEVLPRCSEILDRGAVRVLSPQDRGEVTRVMTDYAQQGLRVLAVARRSLPNGAAAPSSREEAERDLCLLGLVAMIDPPRAQVAGAIASAHQTAWRPFVW